MTEVSERLTRALADRYRIERELGAGGMATVYLAQDLKHDRKVAVKVLRPELAAVIGAERFLTEIKTTANLQHPHILPLFDSGVADSFLYYVMPYVEGESLRDRLNREKQLPISDAVRIATEVGGALDYAHRHNVIHRDIKPENILLHDGRALVADFGIALAASKAGGTRMTETGMSLGTPHYMSPEQAMGERNLDARTDVYALGCVLYEMLAGDPPFTGSTAQAIVAKVMTEKPAPLGWLRETIPEHVEDAVFTALAKLPADRFASAAEFAAALGGQPDRRSVGRTRSVKPTALPPYRLTALFSGALLLTGALALWGWLRPRGVMEQVTRVAVAMPAGQEIQPQIFGFSIDLSDDGSRLAYVGSGPTPGSTQLWVRPLDALTGKPVPGTLGASSVRWSPDGRFLWFGVPNSTLGSVVPADGGQATTFPGAVDATWGASGRLYSLQQTLLVRQTPGGGTDTLLPADTAEARVTLTVLPDEGGVLFAQQPRYNLETKGMMIVGAKFPSGARSTVVPGIYAEVLPTGELFYVAANGGAFVAPFDAEAMRLTGPGIPFARVALATVTRRGVVSYPQATVSANGTLAYLSGQLWRERLLWLDPRGQRVRALASEGDMTGFDLSPDGTRVALALRRKEARAEGEAPGFGADIWVEDLRTGARTRLTTDHVNGRPAWSPDGRYVLYARIGGPAHQSIHERRSDASEPEREILTTARFGHSLAEARWFPDHRTLVVRTFADGDQGRNIYLLIPGIDSVARPVANTPANEESPRLSPDGALLVYLSDETGTPEVYVQDLHPGGARLAVSRGGATGPRWSRDGRTLYFWSGTRLMAAMISIRPTLAVTALSAIDAELAPATSGVLSAGLFDVAPDGRFLIGEALPGSFQLILVRNWMAELARAGGQ